MIEVFSRYSNSVSKVMGDNTDKTFQIRMSCIFAVLLPTGHVCFLIRFLFAALNQGQFFRYWHDIDDCHIQGLVLQRASISRIVGFRDSSVLRWRA